jgi:hypothetical protein
MTRAFCSALLALTVALLPCAARATLEADPQVLYHQMKAAYAKAQAHGWDYVDQAYYLGTIFNAGRAYSLQRPNDPAYGEIATLAVEMGAALHYDPLTNADAATWYVREASLWVGKNTTDPALLRDAAELLLRVNAEDDDPAQLAALADQDAQALAADFPHDLQAEVMPLQADWSAWLLTRDPAWRSKAIARATQPTFPIAELSPLDNGAVVDAVHEALANVPGFTAQDRANAQIVAGRLAHVTNLDVIARVQALPESVYLTRLAPADEYFGPMGMSVLGIENEMRHVNFMLDYHYGNRESGMALQVALSIDDMHRVYPQDRDMAKLLYECIAMLNRMTTPQTQAEARHLRAILTVEYQTSPQAQALLSAAAP